MIVVDTSVLLGYIDKRDVHHSLALHAMSSFADGVWGKGLLLEHVFLETVSVLKRKRSTVDAIEAGYFLRRAHQFEFVPCSDHFLAFWNEYQSDYLSTLSFIDTAVAVMARQRAGGKVLTFDRGFRNVPGIQVLPAPVPTVGDR